MTRAKTDCFAYKPGQQKPPRRKAECAALDKLYCRDGECSFYKEQQSVAGYPKDEYRDTQNMSIPQRNVEEYPESEYGTQNISMAGKLIRAQGEQIRETPAEYVARKCRIRGDADGRLQHGRLPETGSGSSGDRCH